MWDTKIVTFVSLMAISVLWLVMEASGDIAVLIRCFVNKKSMEKEIIDILGNGFSRAPFATVVVVCTAVSILIVYLWANISCSA